MSIFWSVFYGVLSANALFYVVDIVIENIKANKRKRGLDLLWQSLEDEEDED